MLKKNNGERIESSIDVSDAEAVEAAVSSIGAYAAENYPDTKQITDTAKNIFALSHLAYKEKTGLKKGDTVDVIISGGKITFKDLGKDYRLIKSEEYIEKIKEMNGNYENVLMIGMNYSSIKIN
jgi:hypothetical protein